MDGGRERLRISAFRPWVNDNDVTWAAAKRLASPERTGEGREAADDGLVALKSTAERTAVRILGPAWARPVWGALALALLYVLITISGGPSAMALDDEEAALLNLINQYRAANGLGPLALDDALTASARWMAGDMAAGDYLGHTDSLGRDPVARMAAFGYDHNTWKGENLAAGIASAEEALRYWQQSPPHNANLLSPNFTVIGIGRVYREGTTFGWYWANDFGGQGAPAPPPLPAALPAPEMTPEAAAETPAQAPPEPTPVAVTPAPSEEPTPTPSPQPSPTPIDVELTSAEPRPLWGHVVAYLQPWWRRLTVVGAADPILWEASYLAARYLELAGSYVSSQGPREVPALAIWRSQPPLS